MSFVRELVGAKKKIALWLLLGTLTRVSHAQLVVLDETTTGTTQSDRCTYTLFDSGGTGAGGPYSNEEDYVITICPNSPTDIITLRWIVFDLDCTNTLAEPLSDADRITVYDGNSTAAPLLGTYTCGQTKVGDVLGATADNTSRCLTIRFQSNAVGDGNWSARLSCETPCDPPTARAEIVGGATSDSILTCVGKPVTFSDAGSTAGTSGLFTLEKWVWNWMDHTGSDTLTTAADISHTFSQPGLYNVQLKVVDDNGCSGSSTSDLRVYVATLPDFDPFPSDTVLCEGESLSLTAQPNEYEVEWTGFPTEFEDAGNCMPDSVGMIQETPLLFSGYDPDIALDNTKADISSICVDIEHSYLKDVVIQLQCPNGKVMTLYQQEGDGIGDVSLGEANDTEIDCDDPATFGTPWTYCFTESASKTWEEYALENPDIDILPAGDYLPHDAALGFAALDGCPINGEWKLLFTDMWKEDDGHIPKWSINFSPLLTPVVTAYTSKIGTGADSSYWDSTGSGILSSSPDSNSITVQPPAGTHNYTYSVKDDFGCVNERTVTVEVKTHPVDLGSDTALCGSGLGVALVPESIGIGCNYVLELKDDFIDGGGGFDGWNDNTITITVDGTAKEYTLRDGLNSVTYTIPVKHGGDVSLQWNNKGFAEEENEIYFYDAEGTRIHSDGEGGTVPSTSIFSFSASCWNEMTYRWTPDDGTLSDPSVYNPIASPVVDTTYVLSVHPVGRPACTLTDTIKVSVLDLNTGTDSTALLCVEGPEVDLWDWLGGTPQRGGKWYDPSGQRINMPVRPTILTSGAYTYRKDSLGCTSSTSLEVRIFQTTVNAEVTASDCQGMNGAVLLDVTSGTAPHTYSNDGGLSYQASSVFESPAVAMGGGTTYAFSVKDSLGCVTPVSAVVNDIPLTLDTPLVTGEDCPGACDGSIVLSGDHTSSYSIDNGVTFQPDTSFDNLCPAVYTVVAVNGFGCEVTSTITVDKGDTLSLAEVSSDTTVCHGDTVETRAFAVNGKGSIVYTWEADGVNLGSEPSVDILVDKSMSPCVVASDDCPFADSVCFAITKLPAVQPTLYTKDTSGCPPLEVTIENATKSELLQTNWRFSDGDSAETVADSSVAHQFDRPGDYDVTVSVLTTDGCSADTTYSSYIEVFSLPDAQFDYWPVDPTVLYSEVEFKDRSSTDVVAWYWDFGEGVTPPQSTDQHPEVVFPREKAADYPVVLSVYNAEGCSDTIAAVVQVANDVTVYAPNSFTPNGDGFNETWNVYPSGIDESSFHLRIFDRYGGLIWESTRSDVAWKGVHRRGHNVGNGVYVWIIDAKDKSTEQRYVIRGLVTVLR